MSETLGKDTMDIKSLIPPNKTNDECYKAGFDSGLNGPNTTNCHFSLFATKEKTARWEAGQADGEGLRGTLDHEQELNALHG